jgi:hypothetical protein
MSYTVVGNPGAARRRFLKVRFVVSQNRDHLIEAAGNFLEGSFMSSFDVAALMLVVGVVIGALSIGAVLWVRKLLSVHHPRLKSEDARDLAMGVALALDGLVGACYAAAHDFPEIDVEDPTNFFLHADDPVLVLPKDANWSLLGRELSDEVRWMPNRLRNVLDALESIEIDPPDFNDLFEHRQDDLARLGVRALDLVDRICAVYELPVPERPAYYNPRTDLLAKISEMDEFWKRKAESAGQVPNEPSNITPIFGRTMFSESKGT